MLQCFSRTPVLVAQWHCYSLCPSSLWYAVSRVAAPLSVYPGWKALLGLPDTYQSWCFSNRRRGRVTTKWVGMYTCSLILKYHSSQCVYTSLFHSLYTSEKDKPSQVYTLYSSVCVCVCVFVVVVVSCTMHPSQCWQSLFSQNTPFPHFCNVLNKEI